MTKKESSSIGSVLVHKFKELDLTSEYFNMTFDQKGRTSVGTILGTLVSLFLLSIIFFYSYAKFLILKEYGDSTIIMNDKEKFYSSSTVLSDKIGFNIAFGMVDFASGENKYHEDPDFGTLRAIYRAWNETDVQDDVPIPTRRCTREDFNLDAEGNRLDNADDASTDADPDAPPRMFPVSEEEAYDVARYGPYMNCFDTKI